MDPYELVKVVGTMEDRFAYDTYKLTVAPGVTVLDVYAEWATTNGSINLFFWDESNTEEESSWWGEDHEPEGPYYSYTIPGPGTYYIGVYFNTSDAGFSYNLVIRARP